MFLEVETRYNDWFPRMCEYGFSEGQDFYSVLSKTSAGGRPSTDHDISIDMAKQICMIQRTEKGKEARQYFLQIEKDWNSPEKVMARALVIANQTIERQAQFIEEAKPKVEFFDAVAGSKDAIEISSVAKVLGIAGMGRNKLFAFLRDKKILMSNNQPYQKYVDGGYFRVLEQKYEKPNGDTCINIKTLVFQKGVAYIKKLINGEENIYKSAAPKDNIRVI